VPSSYNALFPEAEVHGHVGDAWYQTTVRAPRAWAGERIVLRFGSATHRAVVWVDGAQVAEHEQHPPDERPFSPGQGAEEFDRPTSPTPRLPVVGNVLLAFSAGVGPCLRTRSPGRVAVAAGAGAHPAKRWCPIPHWGENRSSG
jgi:hypothetical protein